MKNRSDYYRIRLELKQRLSCLRPVLLLNWYRTWGSVPVLSWIAGAEYFKRGEFRLAAREYERGIKRHKHHPGLGCAMLDLGYCLFRLGELRQAVSVLSDGLNLPFPPRDTYLLLAKLRTILGQPIEAISVLRSCLRRYPGDAAARINYCVAVSSGKGLANQIEQVRFMLRELRSEVPLTDCRSTEVDFALALFELRYGEVEYGEQLLSRVLATGVAPFDAVLLRGERWLETGRYLQARDQLQRASKLNPHDPRSLILLSRLYLIDQENLDPSYAVQLATEACRKSEWQNPEALSALVDAYEGADDEVSAQLIGARLRALTSTRQINLEQLDQVSRQLERLRINKGRAA